MPTYTQIIICTYVGIIININSSYAFKSYKINLFLPLLEENTVSVWRIETLKLQRRAQYKHR